MSTMLIIQREFWKGREWEKDRGHVILYRCDRRDGIDGTQREKREMEWVFVDHMITFLSITQPIQR